MCEPLRGKVFDKYGTGRKDEIWLFLKEDVKSAVEFYKKYRDRWNLLLMREPKIYDEWIKSIHPLQEYNIWLFDYCFGDVIDG